MNASDIYGSRYLNAKDLQGRTIRGQIVDVSVQKIRGKEQQEKRSVALTLEGCKKQFLVNATNAKVLMDKLGDEIESWLGATIVLGVAWVDFGGRQVQGLRIQGVVVPETNGKSVKE